MSFIAGYFSRKGKFETVLLEEKVKTYPILSDEEPDSYENLIIETKFGHIIQKCKRKYPIRSEPCEDVNGNLLVRLGFFYSSDPMKDDKKLLALCVTNSAKALEECEGEFVFIFYEKHSGNVHIINDRFASRPFYILQDSNHTYFSSSLAFLLYLAGSKYAIDIIGWFQIFSYGHTCGMRTTIKDVRRLKPSTHLTISPNENLEKQYWRLKHEPETGLDPITYSAEVFEAFQSATALRAKIAGKGVVALSGGLDSRMVAASLPKGVDFSAFTFADSTDTSSTVQTKAAAQVCKILGLDHRIERIRQAEFSQSAKQVIKLTGGLRPLHHMAIVMLYIHEIRQRGLNFLLGGGPGDVLAGSYIPSVSYLDPKRVDECIRDACDKRASRANALALLFRRDIVKQYSGEIYGSLLDSFGDVTGPTAAHRITAWAMIYRQPAFTFTSLIHNHPDVTEAFCHLGYNYCELMLRLPAEWLFEENFYAYMIYSNLPNLRDVIYANTSKPLAGDLMQFDYRQSLAKRAKSLVADAGRKILHQIPLSRKLVRVIRSKTSLPVRPSYNYSLFRKDEMLLEEITDCLHSHESLKEVLDTKKCIRFLDNFKSSNLEAPSYTHQTELLGSLATMCLSFRYLNL